MAIQFPDEPRSELESTIGELVDRAQRVLSTQGRLRSLLAANRAVVEELDLSQVLKRIVEAAVSLVGAQFGALGVIDDEGRLERFIHVGMPTDDVEAIGHLPEGHGLLGAVIDAGEAIRLDDLTHDPRSVGFPAHHPRMGPFLGVPIRVRDTVYGNLYLTNPADGPFTAEDEELVEALAATAGIAIDNARLYEETKGHERLSTALAEVTSALLSPDTSDVLGVVAERVATVVDASLVCVVVPHSDTELRIDIARGEGSALLEGRLVPARGTLAARALANGTITAPDREATPIALGAGIPVGPTIAAPFVVDATPLGVLCISRSEGGRPFSRSELTVAAEFATRAGLAVALAWARLDRQRLELAHDRSRIARDLHDHVIQRLFGTGLKLQAIASVTPAGSDELIEIASDLDSAIGDIRTAIFALTPRSDIGSPRTRHRLLDVVTDLGSSLVTPPRITFGGPVDLIIVGELADDVVAVVRESLSNVAHHAHAHSATVDIAVTDTDVVITIDDDGRGMPHKPGRSSGIANLAHRARRHGGEFVIGTSAAGGTQAQWRVPVPDSREDRS